MPKTFVCDDEDIQQLLAVLRSMSLFFNFPQHSKCPLSKKNTRQNLCSFCLIRSLVVRINEDKGRKSLKPVELMVQFSSNSFSSSLTDNLKMVFESMAEGDVNLEEVIHMCDFIIEFPSTTIEDLAQRISRSEVWKSGCKVLFVSCPDGIKFDPRHKLKIENEDLECKAAVSQDGNLVFSSLSGQKHFTANSQLDSMMTFLTFEVYQDSSLQSCSNLKYSGNNF